MFSDDVWTAAAALPIEARARFLIDSATVIALCAPGSRTALLIDRLQRLHLTRAMALINPGDYVDRWQG